MEDGIFSTNGRISRSTYLLRWACIKIPYYIIYWITMFIVILSAGAAVMGINSFEDVASQAGLLMGMGLFIVIITIVRLLAFIIHLALLLPQIVKRLHDMNQSGWFALLLPLGWILVTALSLIPKIGFIFLILWMVPRIIFFLILVVADGTVGDNQYGEDPEKRIPHVKSETY